MSKLYKLLPTTILLLAFLFNVSVGHALYSGEASDVPRIENLLNVLTVQKQELEKLMSMLSRLDDWKSQLNKENARLYQEGELAKADRKKFEDGEVSELELNKKWHSSGRSLRHDQALKAFQEDVAGFNSYVKEYNAFTKKMSHVLEKRTPLQIKSLIKNMKKLVRNMREAMDDGNITKALYIAKHSTIAKEFGFSQ